MILIYTHSNSLRLTYICNFIFTEQLGIDFQITQDKTLFEKYTGPRFNYSNTSFSFTCFHVPPHTLLFEAGIKEQKIECYISNGQTAFFSCKHADLDFDILAASFYLLSRYEEYLPHKKDSYGRYAHENSLAYKEGFLSVPLVNRWILLFKQSLLSKLPNVSCSKPSFSVQITFDIDMAWSYKHKGWWRNAGAFIKKPGIERINVLLGGKQDPFDVYDFLETQNKPLGLPPIYFFLIASQNSQYDKNILPKEKAMQDLITAHAEKYPIGLHPSWQSEQKRSLVLEEKHWLEKYSRKPIIASRQHYLRFTLPQTFEFLHTAGIKHEYSMGYGSINGFRASVTSSFFWYNLLKEESTSLRIHPFCFMDANSHFEQKQSTDESYQELEQYYESCKEVSGEMICIFHNHFLGTDSNFRGWRALYQRFTSLVQQ